MSLCDWLYSANLKWLARILKCKEPTPPPPPNPSWTATNGVVYVRCDARHGGAIWSISHNNFEYLPDTDQGGQCQTALQLDGGGEGYNPTEGGSVNDAGGPTSSSVIKGVNQPSPNVLEISTQMAFWQPYQGQKLSTYWLNKRIKVGHNGLANVIRDDITLHNGENHTTAAVEGLTAYADIRLTSLYSYDPALKTMVSMAYTTSPVYRDDVFVNSNLPLITALPDGSHAFSLYSPGRNHSAWMGAGAGTRNASNKLNAAGQGYTPFPANDYSWFVFIVVGTLDEVKDSLTRLALPYT